MMMLTLAAMVAAMAPDKAKRPILPPYTAAYQPDGTDERGLWMEADEHERLLRDSRAVVDDAALNAYVRGVLCRTVGEDRCKGVRLYLIRVPTFNATMSPNGMMEVWTGLLLRVRTEAELAAVLGHEFAHFEQRHGVKGFRKARTATDIMMWANFVSTGAALQQLMIGNFYAYSRAQEQEADVKGAAYLAASPYRVGAAADIWERMMDESDATALGRKRRSKRYDGVSFFASHPTNLQRATYLRTIAAADDPGGTDAEGEYATAIAGWMPRLIDDQIKLNDFGGTEYLLARHAQRGWTPALSFARGELYRQRGHPRDLVSAAEFYGDATRAPDAPVEAWRGLGLSLLRSGRTAEGQAALRTYLTSRPDAPDAAMLASLAGTVTP